jgi:hypothetical protein
MTPFHAMAGGDLFLTKKKKTFSQQQVHIISFMFLYFNSNIMHLNIL